MAEVTTDEVCPYPRLLWPWPCCWLLSGLRLRWAQGEEHQQTLQKPQVAPTGEAHTWVSRCKVKTTPVPLAGMRTWPEKGVRVDFSPPSWLAGAPVQGTRWPV